MVTPYDQKWIPKKKDGSLVPESMRESFQPVSVRLEDRWKFCRRMVGDEVCQVLFYHMATFIWKNHNLRGESLNRHQMTLITKVYGIPNVGEFTSRMSNSFLVPTWGGWKKKSLTASEHKFHLFAYFWSKCAQSASSRPSHEPSGPLYFAASPINLFSKCCAHSSLGTLHCWMTNLNFFLKAAYSAELDPSSFGSWGILWDLQGAPPLRLGFQRNSIYRVVFP